MLGNRFNQKLFLIILSFAIIMPNYQSSAAGVRTVMQVTASDIDKSGAVSESSDQLLLNRYSEHSPELAATVADSVYDSAADLKIERIKALTIQKDTQTAGKQLFGRSTAALRDLTRKEVEQLILLGAGKEDIYWVNLIRKESSMVPEEIFNYKAASDLSWERVEQLIMDEAAMQSSVEDAVYLDSANFRTGLNVKSVTVEKDVYAEIIMDKPSLSLSFAAFDALVNSALDGLVTQQQINQTNKQQYADRNGSSEVIDPASGSLTWKANGISLPGRDGLDLNVGLMYNSNQSFAYMRNSSSPGSIKKYNYFVSRYDLGIGWAFQFPSVQSADGYLFYHNGQGAVYRVDFNANDSLGSYTHLVGYQGKDIQFKMDSGTFSNGQASSAYYLQYDSQKREYFAQDGRLLGIVDRYGNTIKFEHTDRVTYDGASNKVISSITDTLGRVVKFDYETKLNDPEASFTGENITVSVNVNGIKTEQVVFTKGRTSLTFNGVADGYAPGMLKVTDQGGNFTYFSYDILVGKFSYDYKVINSYAGSNGYNLLKNVEYSYTQTSYAYEMVTRNLGAYGLGEEARIKSRNDSGVILDTNVYNRVNYSYSGDYTGYDTYYNPDYLPEAYRYSTTNTLISSSATNGLATTNTFNGLQQMVSSVIQTADGERKETRNTAFHSVFKYLPTKITYADFGLGDTEATANMLYAEYGYTDWGVLQSETMALTLSQFNDTASKTKYTTTYAYEPTYHLLKTKSRYQNDSISLSDNYTYNEYGRLKSYTDAKNEVTNYSYEPAMGDAKKVSKVIEEKTMRNGTISKITTTYSSDYGYAYPTEQVNEFTNISSTGQKMASSTKKKIIYDIGSGRTLQESDASDKYTVYTYDKSGRVLTITYPTVTNLNGEQYDSQDQFSYSMAYASNIFDTQNQRSFYLLVNSKTKYTQKSTGTITYLSNKNQFYDGFGQMRLEQLVDSGAVTQYHIDDLARAVYMIDPSGSTTNVTYDQWGQQKESLDAYGNLYVSEQNSKRHKVTNYLIAAANIDAYRKAPDLATNKINYSEQNYDQWGRLLSNATYKDWPGQSILITESYNYDIAGNVIGYTDLNSNKNNEGITAKYTYDTLNNLISVKDALGQITNYEYDTNGKITKTTIQSNETSTAVVLNTKEYNELGLVVNKKDASSQNENQTYNKLGLAERKTDRNGTFTDYQYDESKQLTKSVLTGLGGATQEYKLIFGSGGIKNNTNEIKVNGLTISQTSTLDALKRVTKVASTAAGYTASTSYSYDKADRTTQLMSNLNGLSSSYTNYQYIKQHLSQVQTDGKSALNSAPGVNVVYQYFATDKIKSITYPTLTDGSTLKTEYTYNSMNRIWTMQNTKGSAVLSSFIYLYDNNGNITSVEEVLNNGSVSTSKTTSYVYDKLNRLISSVCSDGSSVKYSYDLQGNRQVVTDTNVVPGEAADLSFTYDLQNTLTGINKNNSTITFNYLPSSLRYQKSKDSIVTQYNYNAAGQIISESRSDGKKANYIRGDRLLVKKDVTAATSKDYYYLYNGHGDVIQIVDSAGTIVNYYSYDVWGNISAQTEGISNAFKYAGEVFDDDTGLYYLRARYYDPGIGRFINEDTYEGQSNNPLSLNLYTYVLNNPVNYTDPTGHWCQSSDGNWAHPGACSPNSGNKTTPDIYSSGEEIKANGKVLGTYIFDSRGDTVSDDEVTNSIIEALVTPEGAVVKRVAKAAAESIFSEIFKTADSYRLTNYVYEQHILALHGANSTVEGKSKFNSDFNVRQGINDTLTGNSIITSNTQGRPGYCLFKKYDEPIGRTSAGTPLYYLKVVIDETGRVVTAYPANKVTN